MPLDRSRNLHTQVATRPGPAAELGYRIIVKIGRGLARWYWRLDVVGTERVPTTGGFVLAPVHRSNVDFALAALGTPRRVRWMAKHTIFTGPLVDRFLLTFGAFPVNREIADRAALVTCERLVAAGEPVVMFPEGRRKEGPVIEDTFAGPAFVAARQRVPIVPMGIGGSEAAMPIGKRMIRPARITLVIGEPIYPDVELEGRVPRAAIDAFAAELRDELQRVYDMACSTAISAGPKPA